MIKDDIIFCQYRHGQTCEYDIQVVKKIVNGTATTSDGYKVDAETGIEHSKKYGTRVWEILADHNRETYHKVRDIVEAKKWVKKLQDFPELMVAAYKTCIGGAVDKRAYFHELSNDNYRLLFTEKMEAVTAQYKKPLWCGHPFAMQGLFGCPRLLKGRDLTERGCQSCSCYVNPRFGDYFKRLRLIAGLKVDTVGAFLKIKDYYKIEEGQRRLKPEEAEKLIDLYCVKDWYLADILQMLYTPREKRDPELDRLYRTTIQNRLKKK